MTHIPRLEKFYLQKNTDMLQMLNHRRKQNLKSFPKEKNILLAYKNTHTYG